VFVVFFGDGAGGVDDAFSMIRLRIQRVKLHGSASGVDGVVVRPGGDEDGESGADGRPNPVEDRLAGALLDTKELIELVDFRPDLLLGLKRDDHELAALGCAKHPARERGTSSV